MNQQSNNSNNSTNSRVEIGTNIPTQSTTGGRLINQSETNRQLWPIQRPITPYFLDRLNLTRKRKRHFYKEKRSNAKGNSFYFKEIVLLSGPHDNSVPRQGTKLYLKQNQNIVRGVQFSKEWSEQQVVEKVKSIFGKKLLHCNFEFLESVYTQLVPPTLPPGETFNGMMFFNTFKDKIVYARPAEQVIPLPPQIAKSRKRAGILEDSGGCLVSLADEEDAETDDEICRVSGLSCRNDVLDCDVSRSTIMRSSSNSNTTASVSQSSNRHDSSSNTTASVSQSSNQHNNNSNTTASIGQSNNQHSKSDANSNACYFSNRPSISSSTTNVGQPSNEKSKSTGNTATAQETPTVIDLTSEYAYAAMFETQPFEVLSDIDEEDVSAPFPGIDPQPSAEEILRNLAVVINLDEISKFNISRSNLWESAFRGFNRKSFSPT